MTELESLLILNAIQGIGNTTIQKLLEYFGSAKKVLDAKLPDLKAISGFRSSVIDNIIRFDREKFLNQETGLIQKHQVNILTLKNGDYPENLKHIPDAPVILYVKGKFKRENNLAVSIVGSRRASLYGVSMAEKFAQGLSHLGITIVSGMARGVDTAAHQGALQTQGQTIAVLGCGLSIIYPQENKKLFEEIAETGAVISEFPMTMPPLTFNFPKRNRIISGLSLGVIVVEAARKSGALITSRMALEQGREVFAVPGKIDSPNSQGVHELIKQGAKLTNCIEDVLEELKLELKHELNEQNTQVRKPFKEDTLTKDLTEDEINIFNRINDPVHIDDIAIQSGYSSSKLSSVLLKLELKHLVRQLPGKVFVKSTNHA